MSWDSVRIPWGTFHNCTDRDLQNLTILYLVGTTEKVDEQPSFDLLHTMQFGNQGSLHQFRGYTKKNKPPHNLKTKQNKTKIEKKKEIL